MIVQIVEITIFIIIIVVLIIYRKSFVKYLIGLIKQYPSKNNSQECPKCGSKKIQVSKLSSTGDPFNVQNVIGWECSECGHTGRDFFIKGKKK